ncbi:reverse transcriptase domain-containing protein [Tanacetum coccineum]
MHNNSQASGSKETRDTRIEWTKKTSTDARPKSKIHMIQATKTDVGRSRASLPNIAFSKDNPILEHCTEDNPLIVTTEAGILKAVLFPKWVSNLVMVRKAYGTWRMCIEFTSLNKACPKDSYPLPDMDQKIESLEGFKLKCFLDAYKGYHQIRMAREEGGKTSFYIEQGTLCYEKMPFGLKNAGATYQRLMDNMFASQLGKNIEIYVDDMVVKRRNEDNQIADIVETFDILRKVNMKLNQKRCTFRVKARQFLVYIIQAKPEKGCLNKKDFQWNNDAKVAFLPLKTHLQSLPALIIPKLGETLILYLTAAAEAISVILLTERGNVQKPIYFVSRALQGSEINYPNLEKVALALVHPNGPFKLGEHEILYKPRSIVKAHILADFLAESPTITNSQEKSIADTTGKNTSPA